jgi:DNA repair protein RadC
MEQKFTVSESYLSTRYVAEIQLSYKPKVKASLRPKISSSSVAYKILLSSWDSSKIDFVEQFKVILLNRANKVLGILEISSGGISGTVADPKLIFAAALKAGASGVILSHNHPSSNLQPSQADISLTKKVKEGGALLEISVLDHIIVTSEGYYSFADEGLL